MGSLLKILETVQQILNSVLSIFRKTSEQKELEGRKEIEKDLEKAKDEGRPNDKFWGDRGR